MPGAKMERPLLTKVNLRRFVVVKILRPFDAFEPGQIVNPQNNGVASLWIERGLAEYERDEVDESSLTRDPLYRDKMLKAKRRADRRRKPTVETK
jgi:hypothetical protein